MSARQHQWAAIDIADNRVLEKGFFFSSRRFLLRLVAQYLRCCSGKLAARDLTAEDRDQLAGVGLPTLRAGRCLLFQMVVLGHGSLGLETLAARRALEFIDGHQFHLPDSSLPAQAVMAVPPPVAVDRPSHERLTLERSISGTTSLCGGRVFHPGRRGTAPAGQIGSDFRLHDRNCPLLAVGEMQQNT